MSTNQSLITLLRALRSSAEAEDLPRLLDSATTLLIILANPLNVTLLTSQLLSASSIWLRPDGLHTTLRFISIFSNAAKYLGQHDDAAPAPHDAHSARRILPVEKWTLAVIKGADESSPRWRHLCVLAGLLIGSGDILSLSLRQTLESAVVKAANLALQQEPSEDELARNSIVLILAHVLDHLNDGEKANLDHSSLLPAISHALLVSRDGLDSGYILSTMDADVVQKTPDTFEWSDKSATFVQLRRISRSPLMQCLGSLSRVTALSIESVRDFESLKAFIDALSSFTRTLTIQWQQNKLCEIDAAEEREYLTALSLDVTIPVLWHTLQSLSFYIMVALRSAVARAMGDAGLPAGFPLLLATQAMQILRNVYFITSRAGSSSYSQYSFVALAAVDILTRYPDGVIRFLKGIRPPHKGSIPEHPLDRCHDLYFLNTAEHFATCLSPALNEDLLVNSATPYLSLTSDARLRTNCEAAHAVMLAVLSVPTNSGLLQKHIHAYLDTLMRAFPRSLSPRQFRMAVKTLVKTTAPPTPVSVEEPLLPSFILEIVHSRIDSASADLIPDAEAISNVIGINAGLSEQSSALLAIIDSLPFLPFDQLESWLDVVAISLAKIEQPSQSRTCKERLWEVLSNGELDVNRGALGVSWWATKGQNMVFGGPVAKQEGAVTNIAIAGRQAA